MGVEQWERLAPALTSLGYRPEEPIRLGRLRDRICGSACRMKASAGPVGRDPAYKGGLVDRGCLRAARLRFADAGLRSRRASMDRGRRLVRSTCGRAGTGSRFVGIARDGYVEPEESAAFFPSTRSRSAVSRS